MQTDALTGSFANAPVDSAMAFRAALEAMARPGRIETLTGAAPPAPLSEAAGTLLLVLADPETGVHLAGGHDTEVVRDWITFHTGAPLVAAAEAGFAVGAWEALVPLDRFAQGEAQYPDRSATLIVEAETLEPATARLTGPGIETEAQARLPDLDALRANARRFPLGLDFLFCAGSQVLGLPRSTKLEAL